MPRSKRDKEVPLTKTIKQGKEGKKKLVNNIRDAAGNYEKVFVFNFEGMRAEALRKVREMSKPSRFFLGKNRVMALALGKDEQSELKPNLHKLSKRLKGSSGILFTDREENDILAFVDSYIEKDYARGGNIAVETVKLDEGPLTQFPHSIEPHLRSLGLPTSLKKGVVTLIQDYTVCKKGQTLTPEQAKILKLLEIKMSEFRLELDSVWYSPDCFKAYKNLASEGDESLMTDDEDVEEADVDMDATTEDEETNN